MQLVQHVPDKDYLKKKKFKPEAKDFDGYSIYTDWEENPLCIKMIENGKVINTLRPSSKRTRFDASCQYYYMEWQEVNCPCGDCYQCTTFILHWEVVEFACSGGNSGGNDYAPGPVQGGTPASPTGGYGNTGNSSSNSGDPFDPNFNPETATEAEIEAQLQAMEVGISDGEKLILGYGTSEYKANLNKYYKDARQATEKTATHYGMYNARYDCCGTPNAFKHSLYEALHCQTFGKEIGKNLAIAHEDIDGGLTKDMDMHNNNERWKIFDANTNASLDTFSNLVKEAVDSGQMKYIKDGQLLNTPSI